MYKFDKVVFV